MATKLWVEVTQGLDRAKSKGAVEHIPVLMRARFWPKVECSAREYTFWKVSAEVGEVVPKLVQVFFVVVIDAGSPGGK